MNATLTSGAELVEGRPLPTHQPTFGQAGRAKKASSRSLPEKIQVKNFTPEDK